MSILHFEPTAGDALAIARDALSAREALSAPGAARPAPETSRGASAAAIAASHADAVDRDARFPAEAVAALKAERLLGMMVPREFGGGGARLGEVAEVCFALGSACSSTAMIFAMHQIKVACLVHHGRGSPWHEGLLRRLAAEQLLIASSTTEGSTGGDIRRSEVAVEADGEGRVRLDRASTVMSYGAEADGILTTARRGVDAAGSDQVLVALLRRDYDLELTMRWETLGMRGTCSAGFRLRADAGAEQVFPEPYETIHARTMMPVAHVLWSSAWSGIAAAAVARAQRFVRSAARRSKGQLPPGAAHLTRAQSSLGVLRALVRSGLERYEAALADPRRFGAIDFAASMNLLKVETSELAVEIVLGCMRTAGLSAYRNDGDASLGRPLRDVLSSLLMINNDRILSSLSSAALMAPVPAALFDR